MTANRTPTEPGTPALLDREGAARYLSCKPRRIDDLRREGRLLAVLDGAQWRFRLTHLDAFVESLPTSAEVRYKSRWDRDRPPAAVEPVGAALAPRGSAKRRE